MILWTCACQRFARHLRFNLNGFLRSSDTHRAGQGWLTLPTDLHQPHDIVMVQFLQDGDLSVNLLQGHRGFERVGRPLWRQAAWNHNIEEIKRPEKQNHRKTRRRFVCWFFNLRRNPCCFMSFFFDTTFIAWTGISRWPRSTNNVNSNAGARTYIILFGIFIVG